MSKDVDPDDGRNDGEPIPNLEDDDDDDNDEFIGPPIPPDMIPSSENVDEDDNDSDDDEYKLPISHELLLDHGARTTSALAVDPSGSRMVTGGLDYEVKCWDFLGMNTGIEAFRSFCPADGYPINSIDYSCTGDKILIVSGSQQAKVYDRDGIEIYECVRGDMYLHDMAKTKGHVAGLTSGAWHPKDKSEFMTSARDGTCRLWRIEENGFQTNVIKPRASNGLKALPTACGYSKDGLLVACACDDGSIQMWDHRKNFVNTTIKILNAHQKGSETSGLSFSYDNKNILTRGGDDTLKLWDVRSCREPLNSVGNLFNRFSMTDCLFSPNDKLVVTGTSMNRGESSGKMLMYDRDTFELKHEMEVGPSHVVKIKWHPKLNQIMVGCGDGNVRILYNPDLSHNGAVLVAGKRKKKLKKPDVIVSQQIITPHALPMFREERHRSSRKAEEKDRLDPVRSRQPELPIGKAGSGGRVATGGSTLSSYIIRNMGLRNKAQEEGDPREALLKHAKAAAEDPYWVTPAYSRNQPKTIFQEPENPNKKQKTS